MEPDHFVSDFVRKSQIRYDVPASGAKSSAFNSTLPFESKAMHGYQSAASSSAMTV